MLPTVVRSSEEMLKLVPPSAARGELRARRARWKTVLRIVLPTAAARASLTGIMLAVARAMGETAPVLLTALGTASINTNPFSGAQSSLPLFIYQSAGNPLQTVRRPRLDSRAHAYHPRHAAQPARPPARPPQHDRDKGLSMAKRIESIGPRRLLRRLPRHRGRQPRHRAQDHHRADRSVRLRQVDLPAHAQPDARGHPGGARRGQAAARRRGHLRPRRRRHRRPPHHRHGLPAAQPVPDDVDLRQRRRRAAAQRREEEGRPRRRRRAVAAGRQPLERGQGPARQARAPACPAASSSGCASPGPSPSSRRSCSWTSRARRSTRSPRSRSRTS